MKLGKLPRHPAADRLRSLKAVLGLACAGATLPPVPASIDWSGIVVNWPMLANDVVGDCTVVAVGHLVQLWTERRGGPQRVMTDAEALAGYSAVSGFREGDESTDRGAVVATVLARWAGDGFMAGGVVDRIGGACLIDQTQPVEVKQAVALLGGCYAGVELPLTAEAQVQAGQIWDVQQDLAGGDGEGPDPAAPGSWGGHAIPIVGYSPTGLICITWGKPQRLTWAWWVKYASEAYAVLPQDLAGAPGVDAGALAADMAALQAEVGAATPLATSH